jgi:hypothetical protein
MEPENCRLPIKISVDDKQYLLISVWSLSVDYHNQSQPLCQAVIFLLWRSIDEILNKWIGPVVCQYLSRVIF